MSRFLALGVASGCRNCLSCAKQTWESSLTYKRCEVPWCNGRAGVGVLRCDAGSAKCYPSRHTMVAVATCMYASISRKPNVSRMFDPLCPNDCVQASDTASTPSSCYRPSGAEIPCESQQRGRQWGRKGDTTEHLCCMLQALCAAMHRIAQFLHYPPTLL